MRRNLYLAGAILGFALPYAYFIPFLFENGMNLPLLLTELFANHISAFFGMDVIVTALVLWVFVYAEGRRLEMKNLWVYVACTLVVGVSLALPLFLFLREGKLASVM